MLDRINQDMVKLERIIRIGKLERRQDGCSPTAPWRRNKITAPMPWIWKLRFGEITDKPNITEQMHNRPQNTSAPLKFFVSLYSPALPSNNTKNEIGIGKDANSKRNSTEL